MKNYTTEQMRLYMREKRKERLAVGDCVECGSRKAVPGCITCFKCKERGRLRMKRNYVPTGRPVGRPRKYAKELLPNTAEATAWHNEALARAREKLGQDADVSAVLQEAAKIQTAGRERVEA